MAFACPPDCGRCCSELRREPAPGDREFRALLREHGIYHCTDGTRSGLAVSTDEAAAMREAAAARGVRLPLHPRTFLLESRRRATVVLDWHMPAPSCPLLDGARCGAYEARPRVCRAYPVMGLSPFALAPECPEAPVPRAAVRVEVRARNAIERAHAKLDELAWLLLERPDARFAKGLPAREAAARARRYRIVPAEAFERRALATS